jgi:uncharacterized protein (UPF0335 family)
MGEVQELPTKRRRGKGAPATPPAAGGEESPEARTDGGQEQVIKVTVISDKMDQLVKLHHAAAEASEDLSDAIKKAAEKSGMNAKALRSFVAARAGDKYEERARDARQLALLFDEVGE